MYVNKENSDHIEDAKEKPQSQNIATNDTKRMSKQTIIDSAQAAIITMLVVCNYLIPLYSFLRRQLSNCSYIALTHCLF